jgi:hypothetical protein
MVGEGGTPKRRFERGGQTSTMRLKVHKIADYQRCVKDYPQNGNSISKFEQGFTYSVSHGRFLHLLKEE